MLLYPKQTDYWNDPWSLFGILFILSGSPSPPIYFYSPLKINLCCSEALANSGHILPYVGQCHCYPRLQSQCALHHEDYGDGCCRHVCQSSDIALTDHSAVPLGAAHDIRRGDPDERRSCEKSKTCPSWPTSDCSSGCSGNPVYNFGMLCILLNNVHFYVDEGDEIYNNMKQIILMVQ